MSKYGYPRYELSYYSNSINAHAFQTFETLHEARGELAKLRREDRGQWFKISLVDRNGFGPDSKEYQRVHDKYY